MTTTITREQRNAILIRLIFSAHDPFSIEGALDAGLEEAFIEVERTAEERIAAFVAEMREWHRGESSCGPVLIIERHFPEVRGDAG